MTASCDGVGDGCDGGCGVGREGDGDATGNGI